MIDEYIYSVDWRPNGIIAGKAIILLYLIEYIVIATKYLKSGSI